MSKIIRWLFVCTISITLILTFSVVGCKETGVSVSSETESASKITVGEETPKETIKGKLEVFSSWTAGGEAEAKEALFKVFNEVLPNVEIVDSVVAGGANFNSTAVLATRLQGGDPPDTFQDMPGPAFNNSWASTGLIEPLNNLFEEMGWFDVYNKTVLDLTRFNGEIFMIPLDIHRTNVVWYNKKVFEENNIQIPKSWDEFFVVAESLKKLGITPLTLGDKEIWTMTTLFENILLSYTGPNDYIGLFNGSVSWDSSQVKEALTTTAKILDYVNEDHSSLLWDEAMDLVMDGKGAMHINGDWTEGYLLAKGYTPNKEFGWAIAPGTEGIYNALGDGFCVPADSKNKVIAIEWLKVVGSKEGQDAFNPVKGSIPPRTDCDINLYDAYLQSAIKDFATNTIVPSIAHGLAVDAPWLSDISDIMTQFVSDKDVNAAALALQNACERNM